MTPEDQVLHDHLLGLEHQRCEALAKKDYEQLATLISPDLVHTHTRGNVDSYGTYLRYVQEVLDIQHVERPDLEIHLHGDTAVMLGTQINTARWREGDSRLARVESRVIQVWVKGLDDQWLLHYFQATGLGLPQFID